MNTFSMNCFIQQHCYDMTSEKKKMCTKKSQLWGITFSPVKNFHCLLLISSRKSHCTLMQEDKVQQVFMFPRSSEIITTKPFKNNWKLVVHNWTERLYMYRYFGKCNNSWAVAFVLVQTKKKLVFCTTSLPASLPFLSPFLLSSEVKHEIKCSNKMFRSSFCRMMCQAQ